MLLSQNRKEKVPTVYPTPRRDIYFKTIFLILLLILFGVKQPSAIAQANSEENIRDDATNCLSSTATSFAVTAAATAHVGTSPFAPPEGTDTTFVVDDASGLDTGCTFRNGGPLVFSIQVTRNFGDRDKLQANNLIKATLRMPAYDVDFNGGGTTYNPERDRVLFNGHVVPSEFLTGDNNIWILNSFTIEGDWINFADENGNPGINTIEIQIDTANPNDEVWCTAIDWAALTIEAPRPVLLIHGINPIPGSNPTAAWANVWKPNLQNLGIPVDDINLSTGLVALDSIQNNSVKISTKIEALLDKWGVDKVNIVAHSKGGLDSRDYIENHNTVEVLAQMGTPNAGSPLADAIQAGTLSASIATGIPISAITALSLPAGYQLTTVYMAGYNLFHGHNSNTNYIALAGDYEFDSLLGNIFGALFTAFYLGDHDLVVPKWSVHALNYTNTKRTYRSVGANKEAQHTSQISSGGIYDDLIPYLTSTAMQSQSLNATSILSSSASLAVSSSVNSLTSPSFAFTGTVAGTIAQGDINTHTLDVDGTSPIGFSLNYSQGDLDLALISPSGVRIKMSDAATNPDVNFDVLFDLEGMTIEGFALDNAEMGTWTLEVSAPQVVNSSGVVPYFIMGWLSGTTINLDAELGQPVYQIGDPIDIFATLEDIDTPIVGATVTASIVLPDETIQSITLVDDGTGNDLVSDDGVYSGIFGGIVQGGLHRITVNAEGQQPIPFSRQILLGAPVTASASQLSGTYSDFGEDTDSDGLYNNLVIGIGVDISAIGEYVLYAELLDSNGAVIDTASTRENLSIGHHTVNLNFDGEEIFKNRIDGPYILNLIRLGEDNGFAILPLEERTNVYTTEAYGYRDFQHSAISVMKIGNDQGIDNDGNVLYDILEINLNVEVDTAGYYQWTGQLVDSNGAVIDFTSNSGLLNAGSNYISFSFEGASIGGHGVDGPYFLNDLLIYSSFSSAVVFQAYTTLPYQFNEFEGFSGNNPPVALCQDVTIATASDSCEASALIDSGSYDPDGDLFTLAQTPPGPYELGETPVTLTVTDEAGETDSCTATVTVVDETPPTVSISQPLANQALQDGVTLVAEALDNCSLESVRFSIQEPSGTEVLSLNAYLESGDIWQADFNSTSLPDGNYVLVAIAQDESGNEGQRVTVPFSIRNWAVLEHLPSTPDSKAGRTMPVKFSLRIAKSVDPAMPFVRNEELEIRITDETGTTVYQSSYYGDSSKDYRIDGELYITNFKTFKQPQTYQVQIWRPSNNFLVGEFSFATTK